MRSASATGFSADTRNGTRWSCAPPRRVSRSAGKNSPGFTNTIRGALASPGASATTRDERISRSESFPVEASERIEQIHFTAMKTRVQLNQPKGTLRQRAGELADARRLLKQDIVWRQAADDALKRSEQHHIRCWKPSCQPYEPLRQVPRQIQRAQETGS